MGFMGNNSGGIGGGSTKSQSVEDKEIKTKEEDMKRPQQTHFEMASNHGANTVAAEHSHSGVPPVQQGGACVCVCARARARERE